MTAISSLASVESEPQPTEAEPILCLLSPQLPPRTRTRLSRRLEGLGAFGAVIVDRRRTGRDRRVSDERRGRPAPGDWRPPAGHGERRRILNPAGRRVADRRAEVVAVEAVELPRWARSGEHPARLVRRHPPQPAALEETASRRLVIEVQSGDRDAFERIYLRYFDRVCGYLRLSLRDRHEAEDGTQQVFMKAFEALPRFELRESSFEAWLFTIVRNVTLNTLRRGSRIVPLEASEIEEHRAAPAGAPDPGSIAWISDQELAMFVERLPIAQRQVLALRFMLDMSARETGEVLERSEEDVRILQHRALRFLEQRLSAIGRRPAGRCRARARGTMRQAPVLRARRYAL